MESTEYQIKVMKTIMFTIEELQAQEPFLQSRLRNKYDRYINGPEWDKKRKKVWRRDNYMCQVCGCGSTETLQTHHLTYIHVFRESLDELLTVCSRCHGKIHGGIVGRNNIRSVRRSRVISLAG